MAVGLLRGCANAALLPGTRLPLQQVDAVVLLSLDCMRLCGFTSACCSLLHVLLIYRATMQTKARRCRSLTIGLRRRPCGRQQRLQVLEG